MLSTTHDAICPPPFPLCNLHSSPLDLIPIRLRLMQRLLLMRASQPLSLSLQRRGKRNDGHKRVHAALEEQAEDDKCARRGLGVHTADDVEGEDDDEIHEAEPDHRKAQKAAEGEQARKTSMDPACLEAARHDVCCRRQGSDEVERHVRCFDAVLRVGCLLAGDSVDEVVVPEDDEQEHEDRDEEHQDRVIHCRDLEFEAGVLHHGSEKREHDDVEDYDVGEVSEDIGCDPDLQILQRVDLLAVEHAFCDYGEQEVAMTV